MNNEPPQTLPSFDSTYYSDKEISVPCVSKPNFVDESSNIFIPPPQHPIYPCKFCGSNAQYGHYCTPQAPFINPEPGYSQDLNFPQVRVGIVLPSTTMMMTCYTITITPVLSTEEPDNFLSMRDEHLETVLETESDEVIKSSVEDLVPILSEFKGIPDTIDDDSLHYENIEYVEASPHDSEFVSLEVEKIVILEDEEIEDDNLCEKLLKVDLLISEIEALKYNPSPSSEFLTKSSSTSPTPFLEGTNTFHNSLPELENFFFDLEEISSGSTTTHSVISLLEYEAFSFYDDHIEEISSGSTTTQSDNSLPEYDSFIFDLLNDQFSPTDRSDFTHEEFGDKLAHIISPPEYDCFYFRNLPDPGELISSLNSGIRENLSSTTCVNLP
nr:hypothetical protein [Tanacetum cinerariifolium]